jgi:hypothetical protein
MLEQKRKVGKLPINFASERARLIALRDAARDTDMDEYRRLVYEVDKLEDLAKQRHERLAIGSKTFAVANINLRNKQANFDRSLQETTKEVVANTDGLDPFSRRKTLPRVLLATKKRPELKTETTEEAASDTPAEAANTNNSNNNNNNHSNNNNNNNNNKHTHHNNGKPLLTSSHDRLHDPSKELHEEHNVIDLDIPVDILTHNSLNILNPLQNYPVQLQTIPQSIISSTLISVTSSSSETTSTSGPAKLSLADYIRRRNALQ